MTGTSSCIYILFTYYLASILLPAQKMHFKSMHSYRSTVQKCSSCNVRLPEAQNQKWPNALQDVTNNSYRCQRQSSPGSSDQSSTPCYLDRWLAIGFCGQPDLNISPTRHLRSTQNQFRTGKGQYVANLHKWVTASSDKCSRGQPPTINHTVKSCTLTTLANGSPEYQSTS